MEAYPSLKKRIGDKDLEATWKEARERVKDWFLENGYDPEGFVIPEKLPYSWKEIMERDVYKEYRTSLKG